MDDQLREINKSARDGRRDVGRYEKALQGVGNTMQKIGAAGGILAVLGKVLEGFQNVLGNNSKASAELDKIVGKVTVTFTVLLSRITKALPIFKNIVVDTFGIISNQVEKTILSFQIAGAKLTNVFGSNQEEVDALTKQYEELDKEGSNIGNTWEDLVKVFEGTGDEIADTIERNDNLIDSTLKYRKQIIALRDDINKNLKLRS